MTDETRFSAAWFAETKNRLPIFRALVLNENGSLYPIFLREVKRAGKFPKKASSEAYIALHLSFLELTYRECSLKNNFRRFLRKLLEEDLFENHLGISLTQGSPNILEELIKKDLYAKIMDYAWKVHKAQDVHFLILHYGLLESYREIADKTGVPHTTVQYRCERILLDLKRQAKVMLNEEI